MDELVALSSILGKLKEKKPLVHHITNWVTIGDCASATRAIGALPVMAHAREEVEEMVLISSALVLNIGTLTPELIQSMELAGKAANRKGIPIVLDAVGAGATSLRTNSAMQLLKNLKIAVVKGNRGEIAALAGSKAEVRGVEAGHVEGDLKQIARKLARDFNCVAVITGKEDIVARPNGSGFLVSNGSQEMGLVVGTGCMGASVMASFCAVEDDFALACAAALSFYGIAGEIAASKIQGFKGPALYKQEFMDALAKLDGEAIDGLKKIELFQT